MRRQTVCLARLFGLAMTIVAMWILVDERELAAIVQQLVHDRAATFWHCADPCHVGWLLVLRGLVLPFLLANLLVSLASALVGAGWLYFAGAVALGAGLILTYAGFRAAPIVPGEQ